MKNFKISPNKWTFELVKKEALKYKTKAQFRMGSRGAQHAASRYGWMDLVCAHMVTPQKNGVNKWTFESVQKEALKYSSRTEFSALSRGAQHAAARNGWMDLVCAHMTKHLPQPSKWSIDAVKKEAKLYKTRKEFQENSRGAVYAARKYGWMDDVCSHMELLGSKYQRCIYAIVNHPLKEVYVGLTYHFKKRMLAHQRKTQKSTEKIVNHEDTEFIQLTDYLQLVEAQKQEKKYLQNFIDQGYLPLNKIKTGGLGGGTRKWTLEALKEEALKYETKGEFFNMNSGAYGQAHRYGYIDEVCAHMIPVRDSWPDEKLFSEAKKFSTRRDFKNGNYNAYAAAAKKKLLDAVCEHMPKPVSWNLASLKEEALKYKTRTNFQVGSSGAYSIAAKTKLLDEVCSHMASARGGERKWTKKHVVELSLTSISRAEFRKKHRGAYSAAVKYGWVNDICPHLPKPNRWTFKAVEKEAKRYTTAVEFMKSSPGAYGAASKKGWTSQVNSHFINAKKVPKKWNLGKVAEEALKYNTRSGFKNGCPAAHGAAVRNKWLNDVCSHMKEVIRWDRQTVLSAAKKCSSRTELLEKYRGAYNYADKHGFLDEACSHMLQRVKWNRESAMSAAKKCSSRTEFSEKYRGAYNYADKHGFLDEACSHMFDQRQ